MLKIGKVNDENIVGACKLTDTLINQKIFT